MLRVPAAAVVLVAVLAGCGGADDSSAPATGYGRAQASVAAADASRAHFEWTDRAAIAALGDPERYSTLEGLATGPVRAFSSELTKTMGFDPAKATASVTIGNPPHAAVRFDGVDPEAARSALTAAGYDEDGDLLRSGGEGTVDVDSPLVKVGVLNANRILVGDDSVSIGGYEADVEAVSGPGDDSLGGDPASAAIAACFGDVIAGTQSSGDSFAAGDKVELAGAAVTRPGAKGDPVPERICAITADPADAAGIATGLERGLSAKAIDPASGTPMSDVVGDAQVSSDERDGLGVVSATVSPPAGIPSGITLRLAAEGVLGSLLGGPPPPGPQISG